ncbi:hypothetical protein CHLNCDRAFT_144683 [Chlorella variabilis]|uniref:Fatty acid hydroxylase domain-containing protein n=1 Tax=Chlorella variabilis TaxID=554065 RepID=E1ZCT0_CHLVA|nr:hypothetical protein CHLNCDRAFT_144683 [Chlorella variabilis]EFN56100.1 hypothetical protein CHLNCDRAFT_144683 [Chlorella variabilis]|eukprot:XP_005848202.1 hypothetical protein CHLNCDRAFT_144683 [Chlorella variabilis]
MAKGKPAAAAAGGKAKKIFSRKEGGVYDVNVEELMHPGGRQALLNGYCVGRLEGHEEEPSAGVAELVDERAPLLPQVVKLAPEAYLEWVAAPSTGHPVMFANPVVERLTCTQWYVVPLLWLPVAAAFMWRGVATGGLSLGLLPASFVAGVLIWQLMEYSIHRFLFHFDPKTPRGIEWHFMLHGHHHKYPMDFDRLVFPPGIAALVIAVFYVLLHQLLPVSWACSLLGGGVAGYVLYDTTHWALHSGRADWLVGHVLKSSHMDHHYVDETVGYGISSTLYDHVFSTMGRHLLKKAA